MNYEFFLSSLRPFERVLIEVLLLDVIAQGLVPLLPPPPPPFPPWLSRSCSILSGLWNRSFYLSSFSASSASSSRHTYLDYRLSLLPELQIQGCAYFPPTRPTRQVHRTSIYHLVSQPLTTGLENRLRFLSIQILSLSLSLSLSLFLSNSPNQLLF